MLSAVSFYKHLVDIIRNNSCEQITSFYCTQRLLNKLYVVYHHVGSRFATAQIQCNR